MVPTLKKGERSSTVSFAPEQSLDNTAAVTR